MADLPIPGINTPSGNETMLPFEEGIPILFEDDEEPEMGESNLHTLVDLILQLGLGAHLKDKPEYQLFDNLNLYYPAQAPEDRVPCVAPDVMIVRPYHPLPETLSSYRLYRDGPVPEVVVEILSEGTAQEVDLNLKVKLYRMLGVREYILVDKYCDFLPQRLLLKRLGPDKTWEDLQDPDGGVTSLLGFQIVFEADNGLRIVNAKTGQRYLRPDEVQQESLARRRAEQLLDQEAEARWLATDRALRAEEAQKLAETQKNVEAEARKQAEKARKRAETEKLKAEEARKRAETEKLLETEARKRAETDKLLEAEARKRAETDKLLEAEARKRAETDKQNAEEARKRAEDRIRKLEAELTRLRGQHTPE